MKTICTILLILLFSMAYAQQERVSGETEDFFLDFTLADGDQKSSVPAINWHSPAYKKTKIDNRRFQLEFEVKSGIVLEDVSVFLNDFPVIQQRGFAVASVKSLNNFERQIDTELVLRPGENVIRVTARNKEGGTSTSYRRLIVDLQSKQTEIGNRRDMALFFATDEYEFWNNLQNPINDVTTLANELKTNYGFEVEIVKNPGKREVLQKLREYMKKSFEPDDQLLIMFAGHGDFDPVFKQGYLVCRDSKISDEERLSYISHSNLRSIIDNIPNEHILLTIDACFGGTFDPVIGATAHRGMDDSSMDIAQLDYINRKLQFKTRKFLTSGGKEYVSDGLPGHHSPFVRKMLEAIRSYGINDNVLTLWEIRSFIEKINPEPRFGEFGTDEPGSDFIFVVR